MWGRPAAHSRSLYRASPYRQARNRSMRTNRLVVFCCATFLSILLSSLFLPSFLRTKRSIAAPDHARPLEPSSLFTTKQHDKWHGFRGGHSKEKKGRISPWEDPEKLTTRPKSHSANQPDAIVVGSGLAGLSVALHVLDRGGSVAILEKESILGGNSNKASSGINGCCHDSNNTTMSTIPYDESDTLESFRNDTLRSGGGSSRKDLVDVLVQNSASALTWLSERTGVDLSLLAQLGGHSHPRTHRPKQGMVGATIMYKLHRAIRAYESTGRVKILTNRRVTKLLKEEIASNDGLARVVGVAYQDVTQKDAQRRETQLVRNEHGRVTALEAPRGQSLEEKTLYADHVVLATGGFASDRSQNSLLANYRPELLHMPATAGGFSTGDGVLLGQSVNAALVDMSKVQIHPTGWVEPNDGRIQNQKQSETKTLTLAAELLRGVGGILLNRKGRRFCNELGTRDYVTNRMFADFNETQTSATSESSEALPTFALVLSSSAAVQARRHVDTYIRKGLMTELKGLAGLADWLRVDIDIVQSTLSQYSNEAKAGIDTWGKTVFNGVPRLLVQNETFYAGRVTPVLHYCMGGLAIDSEGHVLAQTNHDDSQPSKIIPGLYAVGEVSGGVHGNNRLGGNSLLECAVFGTVIGKSIPLQGSGSTHKTNLSLDRKKPAKSSKTVDREISLQELSTHNRPDDLWISLYGRVYDLTLFAGSMHPGGAKAIQGLAGTDATSVFENVHSKDMLDMFQEDEQVGILLDADSGEGSPSRVSQLDLEQHNSTRDCWVAFFGEVFDVTDFMKTHPGGPEVIGQVCGSDGTSAFVSTKHHTKSFLNLIRDQSKGRLDR